MEQTGNMTIQQETVTCSLSSARLPSSPPPISLQARRCQRSGKAGRGSLTRSWVGLFLGSALRCAPLLDAAVGSDAERNQPQIDRTDGKQGQPRFGDQRGNRQTHTGQRE